MSDAFELLVSWARSRKIIEPSKGEPKDSRAS